MPWAPENKNGQDAACPIAIILAGEEGFEPSNAGIKIRCLNQLGDSPSEPLILQCFCVLVQGMAGEYASREAVRVREDRVQDPLLHSRVRLIHGIVCQ